MMPFLLFFCEGEMDLISDLTFEGRSPQEKLLQDDGLGEFDHAQGAGLSST
jgi:hypothetical protein